MVLPAAALILGLPSVWIGLDWLSLQMLSLERIMEPLTQPLGGKRFTILKSEKPGSVQETDKQWAVVYQSAWNQTTDCFCGHNLARLWESQYMIAEKVSRPKSGHWHVEQESSQGLKQLWVGRTAMMKLRSALLYMIFNYGWILDCLPEFFTYISIEELFNTTYTLSIVKFSSRVEKAWLAIEELTSIWLALNLISLLPESKIYFSTP